MRTRMMNEFSRRKFLGTGGAALAVATVTTPAMALTEAAARRLVDQVVADINRVISSGKSLGGMISDFERIFRSYADVNIIARSTLGADSRRASPAQLRAYTDAFRGYIARKYGKRFREFQGGEIVVRSVRRARSWQEVISTVKLPGKQPFEVKFLVSDKSGSDKFFDMIIEGISLRLTERDEIGAMLDQRGGDINALISDLKRAG